MSLITGIVIGMLLISPRIIPCGHHLQFNALMPIIKPNKPLPATMDYKICGSTTLSGSELAISIQTIPKIIPRIVAIITLL